MSTRNEEGLNEIDIDDEKAEKGPAGTEAKTVSKEEAKKEEPGGRESTKVTVQLDPGVAKRLRTVVFYTPGLTMWRVVQKGVEVVMDRLEKKYGPYPDEEKTLEGGRPPHDVPEPDLDLGL